MLPTAELSSDKKAADVMFKHWQHQQHQQQQQQQQQPCPK